MATHVHDWRRSNSRVRRVGVVEEPRQAGKVKWQCFAEVGVAVQVRQISRNGVVARCVDAWRSWQKHQVVVIRPGNSIHAKSVNELGVRRNVSAAAKGSGQSLDAGVIQRKCSAVGLKLGALCGGTVHTVVPEDAVAHGRCARSAEPATLNSRAVAAERAVGDGEGRPWTEPDAAAALGRVSAENAITDESGG